MPAGPIFLILTVVLINFALTNFSRLSKEVDIASLDRGFTEYALTAAAFTGDSAILSEEENGVNLPEEEMVLLDNSSLIASAAPAKIARRR